MTKTSIDPHFQSITIEGFTCQLLPQKALYLPHYNALILADPHFGKSGHFRKKGMPVPGNTDSAGYQLLDQLLQTFELSEVIILGDLFHSFHNKEWEGFKHWRMQYSETDFILVKGNHDILPVNTYKDAALRTFSELDRSPFRLTHHPPENAKLYQEHPYFLSGHVHPGIIMRGKGKQSLKLPCFHFGQNIGLLPAFGPFTGSHTITPEADDRVFAIGEGQILECY